MQSLGELLDGQLEDAMGQAGCEPQDEGWGCISMPPENAISPSEAEHLPGTGGMEAYSILQNVAVSPAALGYASIESNYPH